jgi:hypothetical protein
LFFRPEELVVETRSTAQADELRKRVEAQLGESIRFVERLVAEGSTEGNWDEDDEDLDAGEGQHDAGEGQHDEAG